MTAPLLQKGKNITNCEIVEPIEIISLIKEDPADNRILECALAAGAAAIVSGDSHLLSLGNFRAIAILNPVDCLENL